MMWGYGWTGLMGLWMVLWGLFWIGVLGVVIWALVRAASSRGPGSGTSGGPSAMEMLRQRYARGEIDATTFQQMRERLLSSGGSEGGPPPTAGLRSTRTPWLIAAVIIALVLLVGGVIASFAYGPYGMMGLYGPGGMMGGYYGQGPTAQGTPAVGVNQVAIQNYAYQPAVIQVTTGTTVTWTNQDTVAHTVTFRNASQHSDLMQQGQTYSYTFTTPGTYRYYCAVHPYMVGTVIVT